MRATLALVFGLVACGGPETGQGSRPSPVAEPTETTETAETEATTPEATTPEATTPETTTPETTTPETTTPETTTSETVPASISEAGGAFRSFDHYNLHRAGDRGAQGSGIDARVRLDAPLADGAPVVFEDAGERSEYSYSPRWGVDRTIARWRYVWRGTASAQGSGLRVALTRIDTHCERERTEADRPAPPEACASPGPRLELDCVPDTAGAVAAMHCTSATPLPEDASPLPWWLAAGQCLSRSGGRPMTGPVTFTPCAP
ncbi:MAG: hypothetical protein R3B82_09760 [Sandaracinaceae bacterium]